MNELNIPAPVEEVNHPLIDKHGVHLSILRLDLIHPTIGGNKWYKLKYNLEEAKQQGHDTILTFGGAYSNHILSTAVAGNMFGFKTIGIIRGEEYQPLNPVLQLAVEKGMVLKYVPREQYRDKNNVAFVDSLHSTFGNFFLIPEGGSNELGVKGCEEILQFPTQPFDVVCLACGTGATLAGIIRSLKPGQAAIGFPVLKNGEFITNEVKKYISENGNNWSLQTQYHFGGYARQTIELNEFISSFYKATSILLDTVYTGKLLFGIMDMIKQDRFAAGTRLLAIHTGNKISMPSMIN